MLELRVFSTAPTSFLKPLKINHLTPDVYHAFAGCGPHLGKSMERKLCLK